MPPEKLRPEDWETIAWGIGGIIAMCLIGIAILSRFRGARDKSENDVGESINKFREMHSQGELTDAEFRTIKAKLAEELRRELNSAKEPG